MIWKKQYISRMTTADIRQKTSDWVERFVVGLSLCPFASAPMRAGLVHITVSEARDEESLAADLVHEVEQLLARSRAERETTLLVLPYLLSDFDDFLDFLDEMTLLWEEAQLDGILQLVSFHPDYQFADSEANDPANATNRSPFPMLHLLREESVTEVLDHHPDPEGIPLRNVELLRRMGDAGIREVVEGS